MMITKYLVRNEHIPVKTIVSHLFSLAFPREYQVSINQELVKINLIPTGKDGYNKLPILEGVLEVSKDEVQARSINPFKAGSNFAAANKEMKKSLDLRKGQAKCTPNFYYMHSNILEWEDVHSKKNGVNSRPLQKNWSRQLFTPKF
jgi:hypothetical protein